MASVMGSIDERIRLGISACRRGERLRRDAGHKPDPFLPSKSARVVQW